MKHFKPILLFCICSFCSSSQAQSLISKLPPDGISATYSYSSTFRQVDETQTNRRGKLVVKAVGTKKIKNITYRWIELELSYSEGNGNLVPGQKFVNKILIPEQSVKKTDGLLVDAVESWVEESWISDGVPQTTGPSEIIKPSLIPLFQPSQSNTKQQAKKQSIKTPLGTLKCIGFRFRVYPDEPNGKSGIKKTVHDYECFGNKQTPFGSVAIRIDSKYSTGATNNIILKLTSSGVNAKSSLKQ